MWITIKEVITMNKIPLPTIGEILREEFLEPLNLSAYAVAKGIDVPTSRIQDLLHDRRKITVDTSVRLGRFFGLSDRYFLNLQNDIDIRKAEETYNYDKIKKYQLA
ncbi:addiction module antidote protein, HigA family [Lactobacillus jensenii DSM 20557]|nr:addiction module antidote protein, HigA family [Lactobacillus jensenii DSM 20557]